MITLTYCLPSLQWRAAMHAGQELDRRAYLHYNSCALRAVLKVKRVGRR